MSLMDRWRKGSGAWIMGLVLLSGFSALVYEVLWTRMLVLIFGATTLAVSTVLTAFMAGLALGSFLFGRIIGKMRNALVVYGILEIFIGLYALLVPMMLPLWVPIYQKIWAVYEPGFMTFSLLRFALAMAVLLIPTTLMGATFPVLSQVLQEDGSRSAHRLGRLYAFNTLGAVAGTFSTGFILLPLLGVQTSTQVAALLNVLIGFCAILLWKVMARQEHSRPVTECPGPEAVNPGDLPVIPRRMVLAVLIVFAVSGFSAMVYEVAWSRTLSLVIGSTLHAFTTMLATFLVGLALGSFICSRWADRMASPVTAFGWVQVGIGGSAFLSLTLMGALPGIFVRIGEALSPAAAWMPALWFGLSFMMMLIPTLLFGALFPLAVRVLQPVIRDFGRLGGDVYCVNTLGAIVGAFSGGFILIPLLGIQDTSMVMVNLNLLLGLLLLTMTVSGRADAQHEPGKGLVSGRWMVPMVILVAMVFMNGLKPSWDQQVMSAGVYLQPFRQAEGSPGGGTVRQELLLERELLFYEEGMTATVTVERDPERGILMKVNGRVESAEDYMRTQVLIGHIPMLMSPSPEDVLVIGFGSGATVGSVGLYPVQSIVAVELENAVMRAARFFDSVNHRPLEDTRVKMLVNDGRNFLLATRKEFDVIIAQPSLPWITGASNLFTREFFELGALRLKAGGVFGQWITADSISMEDLRSVVAAFRKVFPEAWVFQTIPGDLLLVGSRDEMTIGRDRWEEAFQEAGIKMDLERVGIRNPYDLLALRLLDTQGVRRLDEGAVINTDDNALVELWGPFHYYENRNEDMWAPIAHALYLRASEGVEDRPLIAWDYRDPEDPALLRVAGVKLEVGEFPWALLYADQSLDMNESARGHFLKGRILAEWAGSISPEARDRRQEMFSEALGEFEEALVIHPGLPGAIPLRYDLATAYLDRGQVGEAEAHYRAILAEAPDSHKAHLALGKIYERQNLLPKARREYRVALELKPGDAEIQFKIGLIHSRLGEFTQAAAAFQKTLALVPEDAVAHYNLARIHDLNGESEKARGHYHEFLDLTGDDPAYEDSRKVVRARMLELLEAVE